MTDDALGGNRPGRRAHNPNPDGFAYPPLTHLYQPTLLLPRIAGPAVHHTIAICGRRLFQSIVELRQQFFPHRSNRGLKTSPN